MNLYPGRIEELHQFLELAYGHKDRQATDILLARLLKSRWKSPWIILETDYPSRDPLYAWFSFGANGGSGPDMIKSLSIPRVERRLQCSDIIHSWLDRDGPTLLIESEWRRLPPDLGEFARVPMTSGWRSIMSNEYRCLMSRCLRLRVEHPRGGTVLRDRQADNIELARLTARILDGSLGRDAKASASSLANSVPKSFLYWCELGVRLTPFNMDWERLTGGLASIAFGIAHLYMDGRPPDWRAAERLLRDLIPWATGWIMTETGCDRSTGRKRLELFRGAGHIVDKPFKEEIRRLNRLGVLIARKAYGDPSYSYHPWRYRLGSGDWRDLIDRSKPLFV